MKKKIKVLILIIFALLIAVLAGGIGAAYAQTNGTQPIAYLTEEEYTFTNNDVVNGINISDYPTQHYANNITDVVLTNHIIMTVTGDDDIIKIIPEELFKTEGKTFHAGKEWGFFVDCFKPYADIDILVSTVVLFNITNNNNMFDENTKSHLKFQFDLIFQADFAYVDNEDDTIYCIPSMYNAFFNDNYQYNVNVTYQSQDDNFIIPLPTLYKTPDITGITAGFIMHNKYYFTDTAAKVTLYNVNHKNYGDYGYSQHEDFGNVFSQTEFEYTGKFLQEGSVKWDEAGNIAYALAMYGADTLSSITNNELLKSVLDCLPVVNTVMDVYDLAESVANFSDDFKDKNITKSKKITYVANYNSLQQQIANGGLQKTAVISISGQSKQLLMGVGDHFIFDYQLLCPEIAVDNRYAAMFTFNLVPVIGESEINTVIGDALTYTNSFCNNIYNYTSDNYKEVPEYNLENGTLEYDAHVLPNYYNLMQFTPDVSGIYDFKAAAVNNHLQFKIYEANIVNGQVDFTNFGNALYSSSIVNYKPQINNVYLEANKHYLLKTDMLATVGNDGIIGYWGDFNISIDFVPEKIELGNNELQFHNTTQEIFRIEFEDYYWYDFETNVSGSTFKVLDSDFNVIGNLGPDGIEAGGNEIKYLLLTLSQPSDGAVGIVCTRKRLVEYNFNNGTENYSYWVSDGEYESIPQGGTREGYVFNSWRLADNISEIEVTDEVLPTLNLSTISLITVWDPIVYEITYVTNGGTVLENDSFTAAQPFALPAQNDITKDGFVFVGWYTNATFTSDVWTIIPAGTTGNITFYAAWAQETSTISLQLYTSITGDQAVTLKQNGQAVTSTTYEIDYGDEIILPEAESMGYDFKGWMYNGEIINTGVGSEYLFWGDITLTPYFEPIQFTIQMIVQENENIQTKYWLVRDISGNIVLSTQGEDIEYSKDLCPHCWWSNYIFDHQDDMTFYREGLIFNCFLTDYVSPGEYTDEYAEENNVTLACWDKYGIEDNNGSVYFYAYYDLETYRIKIELPSGEIIEDDYHMGDTLVFPVVPAQTGYDLNWVYNSYTIGITDYTNTTNYIIPDFSSGKEENITSNPIVFELIATPIVSNINYNLDENTYFDADCDVKYTYTIENSDYYIPKPTKLYYEFAYWIIYGYEDSSVSYIPHGSTGHINIQPVFIPITYKIQYETDGGFISGFIQEGNYYVQNYTIESEPFPLATPSKAHCNFKGWYLDSSLTTLFTGNFNPIDFIDGKTIFYAKWQQLYVVMLFADSYTNSYELEIGESITLPTVYKDYHNGVWSDGSNTYNFGSAFTCTGSNVTLTAQWTVVSSYNLGAHTRTATYTITDGGRFTNSYDFVDMINNTQATLFSRVKLIIQFTAWEKDDGFQHLYVYNGSSESAKELYHTQFEHGSGHKDQNPADYEFVVEVNMSDVYGSGKAICIRYNASGNFSDTWYNNSLTCEIILYP